MFLYFGICAVHNMLLMKIGWNHFLSGHFYSFASSLYNSSNTLKTSMMRNESASLVLQIAMLFCQNIRHTLTTIGELTNQ
jgi:hypothetical protein